MKGVFNNQPQTPDSLRSVQFRINQEKYALTHLDFHSALMHTFRISLQRTVTFDKKRKLKSTEAKDNHVHFIDFVAAYRKVYVCTLVYVMYYDDVKI